MINCPINQWLDVPHIVGHIGWDSLKSLGRLRDEKCEAQIKISALEREVLPCTCLPTCKTTGVFRGEQNTPSLISVSRLNLTTKVSEGDEGECLGNVSTADSVRAQLEGTG